MFVFCAKLHRNRNKIQYHRVIYLFLICVLIFVNFKNFLFNITMGSVQSVEEKIVDQGVVVGVGGKTVPTSTVTLRMKIAAIVTEIWMYL